jgi:hypothetical protein
VLLGRSYSPVRAWFASHLCDQIMTHSSAFPSESCQCSSDTCTSLGWTSPTASNPDRLYTVVDHSTNASISSKTLGGVFGCTMTKASTCPCVYNSLLNGEQTYRMCHEGSTRPVLLLIALSSLQVARVLLSLALPGKYLLTTAFTSIPHHYFSRAT